MFIVHVTTKIPFKHILKLFLLSLSHFVQEFLSHGWVGKICITQSSVKNAASALLYVRSFHQLLEKDLKGVLADESLLVCSKTVIFKF